MKCHRDVKSTWDKDWDKLVLPELEHDVPCFILYRLDEKTAEGAWGWMLISWVPDHGSTRQKMIYASTKSTLKMEFGSSYIKEDYHCTVKEETTFNGYRKHKAAMSAPHPLTPHEEEIKELRQAEIKTDGVHTKSQTLGGLNCQITDALRKAVEDMKRGAYNYLQFEIDLDKEEIHVVKAENIDVNKLASLAWDENHARFHIFIFKHSYDGDYLESQVFIYTMPGYNCSVKERMMYSSSKAPFLGTLQELGLEVVKKLEVDHASELSEENLIEEIHPKKMLHKPKFQKPAPPSSRGPKRLIK